MNRVENWVEIEEDEVEKILSNIDVEWKVLSMEICLNGRRTTNYKIETGKGSVLMRLYPMNADVSQKEIAIYQRLVGRLPVPKVYQSGLIEQGNSYIVMEYLEGVLLSSMLKYQESCTDSLFEQLGEILAIIHQKSFEKEGALNEKLEIEAGLPPILDWYLYFLNGIPGKKLGYEWKREIKQIIDMSRADLERMTEEFVLAHGDFRPANLLVSDDHISGVLDWEFVLSAPRYFDIGQLIREDDLTESAKQAFYRGYKEVSKDRLPEDWERLARLMDLATMLSFLDRCEEMTALDIEMVERIKANAMFVKR
ncbi:hypothetical protein SANA_03990 [Gottschalkiaceae bacterium SANA]|nr:hypothetical protein SANA_03990 [Gottschalkiaceae bacterium SANA]